MKNSDVQKSSCFHAFKQHLEATASKLNDDWSISDLNELRDNFSQLVQQLKEADGEEAIPILTSLADCDLMQKKILHVMLEEAIFELIRVHFQGYDISHCMGESGHPFSNPYHESMAGYALNRGHLERLFGELRWMW